MFSERFATCVICLLVTASPFCFLPEDASGVTDKADPIIHQVSSGYGPVGDGELFYEQAGNGEHLVMNHDGLLHRVTWDDQFQSLLNPDNANATTILNQLK